VLPILFFVGPIGIRTAVVVLIAALYAGAWLAAQRLRRRGLHAASAYDFILPALFSGLVAARLYYVLVFDPAWYLGRPAELVTVWKGGFGEEGGFLGALAAGMWPAPERRLHVPRGRTTKKED